MTADRPDLPRFDGRDVLDHAAAAAEAVRAINHITGWPRAGMSYPSDTYSVLGQLATVAARLPQACGQITRQLVAWNNAGHIGIDPGTIWDGHPAEAIAEAVHRLDAAARAARYLEHALTKAANVLAYAHYTGPDLDPYIELVNDDQDDDNAELGERR